MRMKDLESESGIPRSAIHFYLREGVLPPPEKTARNAALYGREHLERLRAIRRCKEHGLSLPLPLLKRAVELMDRGVEPAVAIDLERAVLGRAPVSDDQRQLTAAGLARQAGIPRRFVDSLLDAGMLVPLPGPAARFDSADVHMARVLYALAEQTGLGPELGKPISDAIRGLSEYEMSLRNRVVDGAPDADASEVTLQFQEAANAIHAYLFYRWRLTDIARLQQQERQRASTSDTRRRKRS